MTIEQAKTWLAKNEHGKLCAVYDGKQRTLANCIYGGVLVLIPHRRRGYYIDWSKVTKVWLEVKQAKNETPKFIKKAQLATFSNAYLRKVLSADPNKSPYENNLSTGVPIEGRIITLKSFGKQYPGIERQFRQALKERRSFHSDRLPFRGYEATLWLEKEGENGDIHGGLSLEYKDCGNGYYYLLINDDEFIGYDID